MWFTKIIVVQKVKIFFSKSASGLFNQEIYDYSPWWH